MPLGAPVLASPPAPPDHAQPASPNTPGKPNKPGGRRRVAAVVLPATVLATVAAVAIALLTGHGPGPATHRTTHQAAGKPPARQPPPTIGLYSGQQRRGVFQQIDSIAGYHNTMVTTGAQSSDGQVRQQFFVSADGGTSWRLAPVRAADGGEPPLGHAATLVAGGPRGWLAVGPQAIWTSGDGLTWTLAATHGIPRVRVLTETASGFLAGDANGAVWVTHDRVTWRQLRAIQLAPGETLRDISAAAARGPATVISGTVARGAATYAGVWLSTDGGASWTRVTVPADHDATAGIAGLSSDGAGLLAVRPGRTAGGVAYFSQNGNDWHYAGTIDPAGGWSPTAVNGGKDGFAVTGKTAAGAIVAYTGTGTAWTPTSSLGGEPSLSPAVGAGGTVLAAGSTEASETGQQGVLLEATRAGRVLSVPLAGLPGAVVPELAVNAMAAAGDVQVAVGSADGYPAIWRRQHGSSWALVSSAALTSGQHHLAALTSVTRGPHGWLAVGVPGPLAFTSSDGLAWQSAAGNIAPELAGVAAVAAGPAGYVVIGNAETWWSPDLTSWRRVNQVTGSSRVLAVAADAHGFVSAGSHDGQPAMWTTSDGRSWTMIVLPLPAGTSSAVLEQIAIRGSRIVVLGKGRTPFAAVSADGGARWRQVPFAAPGPGTAFTALTAGAGGFTAVGQYGPPGQVSPAAWTSASGTAWTRSRLNGLTSDYRLTALAPAGQAVTAIGSIATEQSQGAFIMSVPSP